MPFVIGEYSVIVAADEDGRRVVDSDADVDAISVGQGAVSDELLVVTETSDKLSDAAAVDMADVGCNATVVMLLLR